MLALVARVDSRNKNRATFPHPAVQSYLANSLPPLPAAFDHQCMHTCSILLPIVLRARDGSSDRRCCLKLRMQYYRLDAVRLHTLDTFIRCIPHLLRAIIRLEESLPNDKARTWFNFVLLKATIVYSSSLFASTQISTSEVRAKDIQTTTLVGTLKHVIRGSGTEARK